MGQLMNDDPNSRRTQSANRRWSRQRGQRGVSLIEVIIALAVLAFGMLGMAAAQISAYRFSDTSRERTLAARAGPAAARDLSVDVEDEISTLIRTSPGRIRTIR